MGFRNSIGGISSGIDKISLYSKSTNCVLSCDHERAREINEAELLFQSLPDLSYQVTKINQYGRHQKRILMLTSEGIQNKRDGFVSSFYNYSDIKTVTNKDFEVFVIEYKNASHPYVYKSQVGCQIVQEITSRLKLRQATDKKKHSFDIAMEDQKRLRIKNNSNNTSFSTIILSTTNDSSSSPILSKTVPPTNGFKKSHSSSNESSISSSPSSSCGASDYGAGDQLISEDDEDDDDKKPNCHQKKRATKLSQLLGNTEEQRVQTEVDKIILSPHSNERKAIHQFMSNFNVLMKNPSTAIMIVRQFIDNIRQSILSERSAQLSKLTVPSQSMIYEELSLSSIIEKSLEKTIILRTHKQLCSIISQQIQNEEIHLRENILKLANKSQEFFGIKSELMSNNNWKSAILELSCLSRCELPQDKLDTILLSARAIYNTVNYEQNLKNKIQKDYYLSADDFLPIYLYVVVNSGVEDLELINQFCWQLGDPEKLSGEGGYYLTVFSSTLSLIKSLNMDKIENATIIDELIPSITLKGTSSTLNQLRHLNIRLYSTPSPIIFAGL
eukprot:gene973-1238_t